MITYQKPDEFEIWEVVLQHLGYGLITFGRIRNCRHRGFVLPEIALQSGADGRRAQDLDQSHGGQSAHLLRRRRHPLLRCKMIDELWELWSDSTSKYFSRMLLYNVVVPQWYLDFFINYPNTMRVLRCHFLPGIAELLSEFRAQGGRCLAEQTFHQTCSPQLSTCSKAIWS